MGTLPDAPTGARWLRVDLHLHTPDVPTFHLDGSADLRTAAGRRPVVESYVEALHTARIDAAVLTDYQGVRREWFDEIRARAEPRAITVLPGAELSIGSGAGRGVHLLLVCDPDTPPEQIDEVIAKQDRGLGRLYGSREQHRDVDLRQSLPDALRDIRRHLGCVVVAAHATEKNGLVKELGAQQAAQLVADGLIDAVDHCPEVRRTLQSTAVLTAQQLDRLACTLSSDAKRIGDIGTKTLSDGQLRATWVKLSRVDAGALRLALHDPQTRVLTRRPAPARHARVRSIEVEGAFLDGLALRFNDDLTTLIGGRGAGKSAVLETLRYALGVEPYTDQTERLALVRRALGSGGRVRVVVDRPGPTPQQYEVTRVLDQQPRVTDLVTGDVLDVPPVDVFGAGTSPVILLQREIQAVARDEGFRRRLLDEIIGDEARAADLRVRRLVELLRRNTRAIEDVERRLADRAQYEDRLRRLTADIEFFQRQGLAGALDRQARARADQARLAATEDELAGAAEAVREAGDVVADRLGLAVATLQGDADGNGPRALADDVAAAAARVQEWTSAVLAELRAVAAQAHRVRAEQDDAVDALREQLRSAQQGSASPLRVETYLDAVRESTALAPVVAGFGREDDELRSLREARGAVTRDLQDERRRAARLRRTAADAVNDDLDGTLQVSVEYLGDTRGFRDRLGAVLRGSRVSADALDAIAATDGLDGVELVRLVERGEDAVTARFPVSATTAQNLVRWLTDEPDRARQVEALAPDDAVRIALVVDGDPRDLAELSGGQKATALLLLLFAQGGRPLILDQPEDDLDNRFVYEDVVALVRREKGVVDPARRRQIIAATHNANIPVNGDAELVISLADAGGRARVRAAASIDDRAVREEIRTVLEGGAEAFRRRAEKYGGVDEAG